MWQNWKADTKTETAASIGSPNQRCKAIKYWAILPIQILYCIVNFNVLLASLVSKLGTFNSSNRKPMCIADCIFYHFPLTQFVWYMPQRKGFFSEVKQKRRWLHVHTNLVLLISATTQCFQYLAVTQNRRELLLSSALLKTTTPINQVTYSHEQHFAATTNAGRHCRLCWASACDQWKQCLYYGTSMRRDSIVATELKFNKLWQQIYWNLLGGLSGSKLLQF